MKNIFYKIILHFVFIFFVGSCTVYAQTIPPPDVFIPFNGNLKAHNKVKGKEIIPFYSNEYFTYGLGRTSGTHALYQNFYLSREPFNLRFGSSTRSKMKFFEQENLSSNFTLSAWIYVDPYDDNEHINRVIFGSRAGIQNRFFIYYRGKDLFLSTRSKRFNVEYSYPFAAPASFDAGKGWYHVTLVAGMREDNGRYIKLYIGKPGAVKYGIEGAQVVASASSDGVISDFGGEYAFVDLPVHSSEEQFNEQEWIIGSDLYMMQSASFIGIQDFAGWNEKLDDNQVKKLHDEQRLGRIPWETSVTPVNPNANRASAPADNNLLVENNKLLSPTTKDVSINSGALDVKIFPNPTSQNLTIKLNNLPADKGNLKINVVNVLGQVVHTINQAVGKGQSSLEINIPNFKSKVGDNSGTYFLQIYNKTYKVLIK